MGELNEKGLLSQIRSKDFDRLYLLYGTDDYLKKHYASFIPQKTVEREYETFNLHILDGATTSFEEIADCANALPLMGGYTCTVVHDMNLAEFITERKAEKENKSSSKNKKIDELIEVISDIPESSIIIFWLDTVQVDEKKGNWIKIIKTFAKYGSVVKLSSRSLSELVRLLCKSATGKGCSLDRNAAFYMIDIVGNDMGTLRNELDKLCLYKKGETITKEDIDECVILSAEAKIFNLARLIITGKADEAFFDLDLLIKQKEEPIKILAIISGAYVDMYRVKAAAQSGLRFSDVATCFKEYKNKMFVLENAASLSKKYSLEQLSNAINLLYDADTRLKSTRTDGKVLLEYLILDLLRI
ncbi:MAG TPA: DNA polymerase III subunit delta [Oscillospiraceae bacterium]|nr:DNA polymerase III subunit delta [Oscillospiraceae bacterium]